MIIQWWFKYIFLLISYFQHLLDTLKQDDVEVRRRLQDLTRKITVLRVNECALTRRYTGLTEMNGIQAKVSRYKEK